MERLLVCKLVAIGCHVEAVLNGVPIAGAGPAGDPVVIPVHEYTRSGANTLALVVGGGAPAPARAPVAGAQARVQLLLPRIGHAVDEHNVRTLASVEWQAEPGAADALPLTRSVEVELPISFPRWRWMDAPVNTVTPALRQQLLAWLQQLARDLTAGEPASFLAATRLRTEELALAYQRDAHAETERLRGHLQSLQAAERLAFAELTPESFALRPVAGGRLLECRGADGSAALSTVANEEKPEEGSLAFPLRLAVVDGKPYVLR